ncbi:MAG TPA: DUF6516 family protein [Pseudomonadales bacterium]|nr:DUF6516 family protein [Pseudomonadales bacterium]
MKAMEIFRTRDRYRRGFIEAVIWRVPMPPSAHPYKYRLVYVVDGKRIVGYDNERGKGDHKHLGEHEEDYHFKTPQQLMRDFMADVERASA